jgi:hypothetical protein
LVEKVQVFRVLIESERISLKCTFKILCVQVSLGEKETNSGVFGEKRTGFDKHRESFSRSPIDSEELSKREQGISLFEATQFWMKAGDCSLKIGNSLLVQAAFQ